MKSITKITCYILAVLTLFLLSYSFECLAFDKKENVIKGKKTPASQFNYSTPEGVVKAIFYAARTGKYQHLRDICDPVEIQSPAHCVCKFGGIYNPPVEITNDCSNLDKKRFRSLFSKAKIYSVNIHLSQADVYCDYGGEVQPAISLTKRNNRWYLFTITLPEDTDL